MNGKEFLIDSNIIIYHFNGEAIATNFLQKNIESCAISRITFMEIVSFDFTENEEKLVIDFLKQFKIIDTSEEIALQVAKNRKRKKIKLPDNIIASTAQIYDLTLVTRNVKDFQSIDVKILNIFEEKNEERL